MAEAVREDGIDRQPRLARHSDLTFTSRFAYGEQAEVAQISDADGPSELGSGFVRLRRATIPWTVRYDEVLLVVEGDLTVRCNGVELRARPGDAVWLPKQTELVYEAENALVFYAIWPADWADREQADGS